MLLVGFVFFVPSLVGRNDAPEAASRAGLNLALHQQRQEELAREAMDSETLASLSAESERNLLGDLESSTPEETGSLPGGRSTIVVVLLLMPVVAILTYYQLGRPDLVRNPPSQTMADTHKSIEKLAERLKTNPDDLDGWMLLGRSLLNTQKPAEAVRAFEIALKLAPENPDVLGQYAQALAENNEGNMTGRPTEIVRDILKKNPTHKTALWLAGIAAAEKGEMQAARDYWSRLKAQFPSGSEEAKELDTYIARTEEPEARTPGKSVKTTGEPDKTAVDSGKRLHVKVSIAPAMRDQVSPEDTVFIFAKAAEGPPMPLAVVRKQVRDLPLEVLLDDSMSMMQGMNISAHERLVVGARVSKSGRPIPSPGDLEGLTEPVSPGQEASYSITINRLVPEKSR